MSSSRVFAGFLGGVFSGLRHGWPWGAGLEGHVKVMWGSLWVSVVVHVVESNLEPLFLP